MVSPWLQGAGKTTLATELGKLMGLPVFYEPVTDNEYLADFYRDMARYSFPLQVPRQAENNMIRDRLFILADDV